MSILTLMEISVLQKLSASRKELIGYDTESVIVIAPKDFI